MTEKLMNWTMTGSSIIYQQSYVLIIIYKQIQSTECQKGAFVVQELSPGSPLDIIEPST
jgi:hypothetical protein